MTKRRHSITPALSLCAMVLSNITITLALGATVHAQELRPPALMVRLP